MASMLTIETSALCGSILSYTKARIHSKTAHKNPDFLNIEPDGQMVGWRLREEAALA
jgi:hypothetical protein